MSYVSLLKNIPEFLSQPTGIAVLASLGIHSAIAFLLPIVPTNSNKPKQEPSLKSSVGLVELSQSEKNRLPQPGIPQLPLQPLQPPAPALLPQVPSPKFANQSIPSLPPLPPSKSSTALILPPLPKTNNLAVASLPKSQSLPILSKKDLQPASLSAKVKPLPRNVEPDPSLSAKVKRLPGYAEPDPSLSAKVRSLPRYPEKVELGEAKPLASSKIPYNVPPIQAANIAEEQELLNTSAPVSPDQMPPSGDVSTATQTTAQGSEVSQGANNQQLVTPVVQPPQVGDNSIALGRQNLPQLQQGLNVQPPELPPLATGRSLSTPSIASTPSTPSTPKTFAQRFTEVKQQYPNLETRQPIAETVDGKTGQQGNVEGDLVINREGQVESIDFHNNSVPSELKTSVRQYFREYFQKNPVQANGKPKFYPFNISFKPNSDISKTPASELSTSSRVNQTQPVTIAQRSLIQRLRSVPVTSLPSKEPQKIEMTQGLRPDRVNLQPSKEPQKVNLVQRSGSSSMKQSQSQTESAPQANLEQQTSRRRRVIVMQNTTPAPQANLEQQTSQQRVMIRQSASSSQTDKEQQTSQQRVVVRQSASSSQTDKEQQTSQQRVVVRQSASSSQTDKEQQTSPQRVVVKQTTSPQQANLEQTSQQEVNSNQSSASGQNSQKLLQQLRQIRDTRQGNNQEK